MNQNDKLTLRFYLYFKCIIINRFYQTATFHLNQKNLKAMRIKCTSVDSYSVPMFSQITKLTLSSIYYLVH